MISLCFINQFLFNSLSIQFHILYPCMEAHTFGNQLKKPLKYVFLIHYKKNVRLLILFSATQRNAKSLREKNSKKAHNSKNRFCDEARNLVVGNFFN